MAGIVPQRAQRSKRRERVRSPPAERDRRSRDERVCSGLLTDKLSKKTINNLLAVMETADEM
ncbi:MAG: hypothetical protein ACXVDD_18160, partial [Polyangia bacterium]